jgi:hypothetical protein
MAIKITCKNQKSKVQEELKFFIHGHCTYFLSNTTLSHHASPNEIHFVHLTSQTIVNFISIFYPPSNIITKTKNTGPNFQCQYLNNRNSGVSSTMAHSSLNAPNIRDKKMGDVFLRLLRFPIYSEQLTHFDRSFRAPPPNDKNPFFGLPIGGGRPWNKFNMLS